MYSLTRHTPFVVALSTLVGACGTASDPAGTPNPDPQASALTQLGVMRSGEALVRGVRFDVSRATVQINGLPSTPAALGEGMTVRVSGRPNDDGLTGSADSVEEENEVKGAISAIGPAPMTFTVLDQLVLVDEQTVFVDVADFAGLALGDPVEVHGSRDTAGVIHATRVEREGPEDDLDEVRGTLSNLGASTFSIGDLIVNWSAAAIDPAGQTLSEGDLVEVHGELSGGVMMASRVEIEDHAEDGSIDDSPDMLEVRFEANLDSIDDVGLVVLGLAIAITATTELDVAGGLSALAPGDGVKVEAHLDSDGVTLAAVRLERLAEPVRAERQVLRGPLSSVDADADADADARTLVIAGLTVDLSGAEFRDRADAPMSAEAFFAAATQPFAVAKARGALSGGILVADEVELEFE